MVTIDRLSATALIAMGLGLLGGGCEAGSADSGDDTSASESLQGVALGDPLPGLTPQQLQQFTDGKAAFQEVEDVVANGLGPVFNEASCATCHGSPTGGTTGRLETRFGKSSAAGFDPLADEGGSLRQDQAIGAASQFFPNDHVPALPAGCAEVVFVAEVVPADANVSALRRTTPLFGLGLVDALPAGTLTALARQQASAHPGTAGVVSMVTNPDNGKLEEGRFGWKAQVSSLHAFSGDAYLNEMGVTNPSFPNESCPQGNCALLACNPFPQLNDDGGDVDEFTDFMTMLAPPTRGKLSGQVNQGEATFDRIGCVDCHVDTLQAGTSPIAGLNHKLFHPYSDFLLHDMGALGDGITQNGATGRLMRTAPLWGVRNLVKTGLLHDGRAHSFTEAIAAHDGQAAAARAAFAGLSAADRDALLAFLGSL